MESDHDILIRHDCEIDQLGDQSEKILKRLDEQDANDIVIKDELLNKIDASRSKFNDAMWAIAMLIIGALVAGFVYALLLPPILR